MTKDNQFKCPKCKSELTTVQVTSKCWQEADINEKGELTDYGGVEEIGETLSITCPDCGKDIRKYIKRE